MLDWVKRLAARAYTYDINSAALPIVDGKGGSSFSDFAALARNVGGAKIIVSVNAYTDTPESARAFARYALTHHIPVAVWELANEPYYWIKDAVPGQIGSRMGPTTPPNEALPGCNQNRRSECRGGPLFQRSRPSRCRLGQRPG